METKHCNKCEETLSVTQFHQNCATRDGRHTTCKACRCLHVALATDNSYKAQQARQRYALMRCQEKAKRVALHMLEELESRMTARRWATHRHLSHTSLLMEFFPSESITAISHLLQSHLGANLYWTGYGKSWRIIPIQQPSISLWSRDGALQQYVKSMFAPTNMRFERIL